MDALRRYVFPVIWMLILGLIALALVKMAFFSAGADAAEKDPEFPTADFDQHALVTVETGDVSSELVLPAMVQPDAGTDLKATDEGEINKIWLKNGDHVEKGQRILQVRQPVRARDERAARAPRQSCPKVHPKARRPRERPSRSRHRSPPPPEYRYVNLVSTATGTISGMEVAEWDALAKRDTVASISPGTYSIVADLTPEQQLSLLDVELDATAKLPTTPRIPSPAPPPP